MKDINDILLVDGSVVDLHQTVNGENIFIVLTASPLDVRYGRDLTRVYEYDMDDLFAPSMFTGELDWEITGNLYHYILQSREK